MNINNICLIELEDIRNIFLPLLVIQILNGEGLKTPRGSIFKNNHVHSIYKKGLIREERINREDIVEVKDFKVQRIENPTKEFVESVWEKIHVL